jgi:2-polyprenyl-6-methoxyphenol hydroxylase-like FAD-dependent oxidoreductase
MHDATALSNLLYAISSRKLEDATAILDKYQKKRCPAVMKAYFSRVKILRRVL